MRCFVTRVSVFSDSQVALRSLSGFLNSSRESRCCFDLPSGRFSFSLVWVPGHNNVLGNNKSDELAKADELLPELSSIELGMPLDSFKLAIV